MHCQLKKVFASSLDSGVNAVDSYRLAAAFKEVNKDTKCISLLTAMLLENLRSHLIVTS